MSGDYLWDPRAPAGADDADVRRIEELLARYRPVEHGTPRWRASGSRRAWIVLATAVATAAAVLGAWLLLRDDAPEWRVHGLAGRERLRAGETLENVSSAGVRVTIDTLGEVDVAPGTRVRAEDCGRERHSLRLERGKLHARITAAPRVFQIDTPAGRTFDLGCEYEVEVGDAGATRVRVVSGEVEFVLDGREVFVPAHARCDALPGSGPGWPEFDEPSRALHDVVVIASGRKVPVVQDPAVLLDEFLAECSDEDTLTLWHVYDSDAGRGTRAPDWVRERVFARLARQFPLPDGVDAGALARGDRAARRAWRASMQPAWRIERRSR